MGGVIVWMVAWCVAFVAALLGIEWLLFAAMIVIATVFIYMASTPPTEP